MRLLLSSGDICVESQHKEYFEELGLIVVDS